MTPLIDGKLHHFGHRGLYNALSVLGDAETGSYWDHVTGRCVHGALKGRSLATAPLLHTTAGQAARTHPVAILARSKQTLFARMMGRVAEWTRLSKRGFFPPGFRRTMNRVDSRLPAMELGLGVWTDKLRRFYPVDRIKSAGGAITDSLHGDGNVVIYIDPQTHIPTAVWIETTTATMVGSELSVNGGIIRDGRIVRSDGTSGPLSRPMQLFTRWYGFSFTFPDCNIIRG